MTPPVETATNAPTRVVVATLHTSAADRLPTPPSRLRIDRLREFTRRDPTWKQDD